MLRSTANITRLPRVERRMRLVEQRLAEAAPTGDIARELVAEHGIKRRSAFRYVACVLERLRREAGEVTREQWRALLGELAMRAYGASMGRKRALAVAVGDGSQRVHLEPDPDGGAATRALAFAAALHGIDTRPASSTNITVNNNVVRLPAEVAKGLSAYYCGTPAAAIDASPTPQALPASAPLSGAQGQQ